VLGVVAGLLDGGLDVTGADLTIGTSAGATAAAQLAGASPATLLAEILAAPVPPAAGRPAGRPGVDHFQRTTEIIAAAAGPADMRRRLGASALALDDGSWSPQWRATVASRFPDRGWPDRALLVTAVDARTGEPVVFDRHSGVDLVDAVAASTASGPPYAIGDDRYLDGGYRRSSENADLAGRCRRVLVLSPLGGRSRAPVAWDMHLAAQVEELRAGGSLVEAILPDDAALDAFGPDMTDLSRRAPAARAGYDQGRAGAGPLSELWR
jgi:NTE family protein